MTSSTEIYRQARDLLQDLSRDYTKAVEEFVWPEFGERFDWAVDWFDANAHGNDGVALWIVEEDASDYKISPFELESVLFEHSPVAEAAIVPAPDEVRRAVPKAYVALAPGYEPNEQTAFEILKHARENLAPFQRIRRIEFFELPKTISGKIRRVDLRVREEAAAAGTTSVTEWRDDQFSDLKGS